MKIILKEYRVLSRGMVCGRSEAEQRKYNLRIGKSGKRWLIADQINEADNIYVEGNKNSDGFGGRTLDFTLVSGEIISLKGPWHSNSDSLYLDTEYDCRDKHYTCGVVALNRESDWRKGDKYIDILYKDEGYTLGEFNRIKKIAQKIANKINKGVYYYSQSMGGSISSFIEPEK